MLSAASLESDKTQFSPPVLASLPDRLRQAQRVFARTGGLTLAGFLRGPSMNVYTAAHRIPA